MSELDWGAQSHCDEPMSYLEWPDYYDGALFLECLACGAWKHRFPVGHWLRARADRAASKHMDAAKELAR